MLVGAFVKEFVRAQVAVDPTHDPEIAFLQESPAKTYGDATLNSLHSTISLEASEVQSSRRTAVYLGWLAMCWVMSSIPRLLCSDRTVNVALIGYGSNLSRAYHQCRRIGIQRAVNLTVYLCADDNEYRAESYDVRTRELARWVLKHFDPPASGLLPYELNFVDISSFILPKNVVPKDRVKANTLARTTLMIHMALMIDEDEHSEHWQGSSPRDVIANVNLLDSAGGAGIKWKGPEAVSTPQTHPYAVCR